MYIVILCDTYRDAIDGYEYFLRYLEMTEPESIVRNIPQAQSIWTDSDLRYNFIVYYMQKFYINMKCDFVDEYEFFDDVNEWYERWYGIE